MRLRRACRLRRRFDGERPPLEDQTRGRAIAEQGDVRDPEPGEFLECARAERRLLVRSREAHHHHCHVRSLRFAGQWRRR
jgi:hypothetical protein